MKTKLFVTLVLLSTLSSQLSTQAQGTAFTYQGRLDDGGTPASGIYDLRFTVYDSSGGAGVVAGPLTNSPTAVSNGLFTVTLDFGAGVFTGADRWLEIGVRTNGGGAFTTLSPRQALTPTPYAIFAANAGTTVIATSVATNGVSTTSLQDSSVTSAKIADGSILAADVSAASFSNTFWKVDGNAGTTTGTHFLGSTDNQPLEIKVNGLRALRLEPGGTNAPNLLAGSAGNVVAPGVVGAVIAGGGGNSLISGGAFTNRVTDVHGAVGGGLGNVAGNDNADLIDARYATVGGGFQNTSSGFAAQTGGGYQNNNSGYGATLGGGFQNSNSGYEATLGGGYQNTSSSDYATLGGGFQNSSSGYGATLGGGLQNTNSGTYATLGGGYLNTSSGLGATVPGGVFNLASGDFSFAAGNQAQATNAGAFVWADSAGGGFASTANDQFLIRASGGVGINTANPVADLHVNGPIVIQGALTPVVTSSSNLLNLMVGGGSSPVATNGSRNGISFYEGAASKAMSFGYDGSGSSSFNALRIYHSSDAPLFTFEASGELGIGTTTPATALHVKDAAGDTEISVESSDPGGHRWTLQSSRVTGAATDASFQIIDRTAGGSRLFIGTNGNVGIRTTSPATALDVNGTVAATFFQGSGLSLSNVNATTLGGLASSNFWQLGGNAGSTPGTHFLGTTDNQPLEVKVRGERALRLEPTPVDFMHSNIVNVVAGSLVNEVAPGIYGATISGGGAVNYFGGGATNRVTGDFGTIAGGYANTAGYYSSIGGGIYNTTENYVSGATIGGGGGNRIVQAHYSVVGGGYFNQIGSNSTYSSIVGGENGSIRENADHSSIGGGYSCFIDNNAQFAVIGGGWGNSIGFNADYATIPGGSANRVGGSYGFAAGYRAKANHDGAFVWADSINADFASTSSNQFLIRASGGVGINTANPVADLHVNGPIVIQGPSLAPVSTSSSNLLNLMVGGGSASIATNGSLNGISFYESAGAKAMSLGYDGSGGSGENALRIYHSSDAPLFTFEASGELGIGTTAPATVLHVRDAASAGISVESSDAGGHRWTLQSSGVSGAATDASFQVIDRTSGGSRLFIGTNGNVGIGTTGPTNRLHVNGGVSAMAFVSTSDRNAKENFRPVSARDILAKVTALPISKWTFKEMRDGPHIGPMAQDFYAAFGLGGGETTITTLDADGVALAAIQGLNQKLEGEIKAKNMEISELKQRLEKLEQLMNHKNGGAK